MKKIKLKADFNDGIWRAVEVLVLEYDQPTMAAYILMDSGIKEDEARAILKSTGFGVYKLSRFITAAYKKKNKNSPLLTGKQ